MIAILDFGSQYTQLIARKIRALGVFAEIFPPTVAKARVLSLKPDGIILSGGPSSVYAKGAPTLPPWVLEQEAPVLGICYGLQLLTLAFGGKVAGSKEREYGMADLKVRGKSPLTEGVSTTSRVWMSHGDKVQDLPKDFKRIGDSKNCPFAAAAHKKRPIYGIQFHPEVFHSDEGETWLKNFVFGVCSAKKDWKMKDFIAHSIEGIRAEVGKRRVICAVSGGVDSTVLAVLLHEAIGNKSVPVFVDNGLLRANEVAEVKTMFKNLGIKLKVISAEKDFLSKLKGVTDPEKKRKIIGRKFIEVFMPHIKKTDMLAQGTLYPDVIESVSTKGPSATIKTHHNRVSEVLKLIEEGRVVEPLRELFKDEVRAVGKLLGISKPTLMRHPFPGPGLAVRVLGSVDKERLELLQSVGVMGDARSYENVAAVRCVTSTDGMTADWYDMPRDLLARISNRIINEVAGINRVAYDISSKPPATIEWE